MDIIKNISIHQVLFVIILRKDGNKLPGVTASHQSSNDTEYSRSDSKYTWRSCGTSDVEGSQTEDVKWVHGREYYSLFCA